MVQALISDSAIKHDTNINIMTFDQKRSFCKIITYKLNVACYGKSQNYVAQFNFF